MGNYHVSVIINIIHLSFVAHILNVNIAILSQDTNEPIIIKQKNALATLYFGYNLNFDDINKVGTVKIDSAYRDDKILPSKSIDTLIANTPYSYDR